MKMEKNSESFPYVNCKPKFLNLKKSLKIVKIFIFIEIKLTPIFVTIDDSFNATFERQGSLNIEPDFF